MKLRIVFLFLFTCFFCSLFSQKEQLSLFFAGDAMQHQSQLDAAKQKDGSYNYSNYFKEVEEDIKAVDFAIINLEVPLAGPPYSGYPAFCAPIEYAETLKSTGFNVILTANNHAVDKGKKGIEGTIDKLNDLGLTHTGIFKDDLERAIHYPLMLIKNGIRIGMLNYTYDTNGIDVPFPNVVNLIDTVQIKQDIADAKTLGADIIITNMHWGIEYKLKYNREQERLANFLIRNGVRLVIGGHPHVVQPVDIRKKDGEIESIIVYSLGNYISGMKTIDTAGGMSVRIDISKEENKPISIDSFSYDLVWTHKPMINGKFSDFQLLKVSNYQNPEGEEMLGEKYKAFSIFSDNATKAIESLW